MRPVEEALATLKASLCTSVDIGGLYTRNPVAHKWKAPYRSLCLRESVAWRTQDLLEQSLLLHDLHHSLGARILLRSALETVAVLIYLNQLTRKVISGDLNFHDFSETTSILLLGSRDGSTPRKSLNILTIIEKCDARYPGIKELYASLSESAHPNYEGTSIGYSDTDPKKHLTTFSNKWRLMYGEDHVDSILLCLSSFYDEYNEEWKDAFEKLELYISEKDAVLESTKRGV
jgi:hypothetical protein